MATKTTREKRLLALLMALVMVLGLTPLNAFALGESTKGQVGEAGGDVYYNSQGEVVEKGADWSVRVSRQLEETGVENLLDVTMQVETRKDQVSVSSADAAVVIALDISDSMKDCAYCSKRSHGNEKDRTAYKCPDGQGEWKENWRDQNKCANCGHSKAEHEKVTVPGHAFKSRLDAAKENIQDFLQSYADPVNGAARYVSLVYFYGTATAQQLGGSDQYWVNVSDPGQLKAVTGKIEALKNTSRMTNHEAAFQVSLNLLRRTELPPVSSRHVVVLTDGEPNDHLGADVDSAGVRGEMSIEGGSGNNGNYKGWDDLKALSEKITGAEGGANLYSMLYGPVDTDTVESKIEGIDTVKDVFENLDKTATAESPTVAFTKTPKTPGELGEIFDEILTEKITATTEGTQVTIAVSPSAADSSLDQSAYKFVEFRDGTEQNRDGNPADPCAAVVGENLTWSLGKAKAQSTANTNIYTLKYRVRLNNDAAGFVDWEEANTPALKEQANYKLGQASMEVTTSKTGQASKTFQAQFPEVSAHGYLGSLELTKLASYDEDVKLGGAEFQLFVDEEPVTKAPKVTVIDETGPSGSLRFRKDGKDAIPSGLTYTLTESKAPEGYETPEGPLAEVRVSYGEVTVTPLSPLLTGKTSCVVKNRLEQTYYDDETPLVVQKLWRSPADKRVAIVIDLYRQAGPDGEKIRSGQLAVQRNGAASFTSYQGETVKLRLTEEQNNWVWELTGLARNNPDTGADWIYTVEEATVPEGFTAAAEGTTVINTIVSNEGKVSVEKQWVLPEGDQTPDVTVNLLANGQIAESVTLTESAPSHTWTGLAEYTSTGSPIVYTVEEVLPEGAAWRQVSSTETAHGRFVLVNSVKQETQASLSFTKVWNDGGDESTRPESVTFGLFRDGEPYPSQEEQLTVTLNKSDFTGEDSWQGVFENANLPVYAFTGSEKNPTAVRRYAYTVKELTSVGDYTPSADDGTHVITNTRAAFGTVTVNKVWDHKGNDLTGGEVTLQLYQNGLPYGSAAATEGQTYTWEVPLYNGQGAAYTYTVAEAPVPGYTASYDYGQGQAAAFDESGSAVITVTNTLSDPNAEDEITYTVHKLWQQPGEDHPALTVTLYRTGADGQEEQVDEKTIPATESSVTFDRLPRYYFVDGEEGEEPVRKAYAYRAEETVPDGYTAKEPSAVTDEAGNVALTLTNVITDTVTVTVDKVWKDLSGTTDAVRSAQFRLLRQADGQSAEEVQTITFSETEGFGTKTVSGLPRYDEEGRLYTYTLRELSAPGYSAVCSADTDPGKDVAYTVTNTLNDTAGQFVITKTWVDGGRAHQDRPAITLNVTQEGAPFAAITVSADEDGQLTAEVTGEGRTFSGEAFTAGDVTLSTTANSWTVTLNDLPNYNQARTAYLRYAFTESDVPGYDEGEASVTGRSGSITNTLTQEQVSMGLTKHWVDPNDGGHPDAVFQLKANGEVIDTVKLGFGSGAETPLADPRGEEPVTEENADVWYWNWTELPKYDEARQPITYTIEELAVEGYEVSEPQNQGGRTVFTNTIEQASDVTATARKTWDNTIAGGGYLPDDKAPQESVKNHAVTVALYRSAPGGSWEPVTDVGDHGRFPLTAGTDLEVENLPRYTEQTRQPYTYTFKEVYQPAGGLDWVVVGDAVKLNVNGRDYTAAYAPIEGVENSTHITNTFVTPELYYYQVVTSYTTADSAKPNATTVVLRQVPVEGATEDFLEGKAPVEVAIDPADYEKYDGHTYGYTGGQVNVSDGENDTTAIPEEGYQLSVSKPNYPYTVELNYAVSLYHVRAEYKDAQGRQLADPVDDPKTYQNGDTPDAHAKAIPTWHLKETRVTFGPNPEDVSGTLTGVVIADADIKIEYIYEKTLLEHEDVDDTLTVQKLDGGSALITASPAVFGVFTDEGCTGDPLRTFSTRSGSVTLSAKDLLRGIPGDVTGTFYLKEITAPTGYDRSDAVMALTVTRTHNGSQAQGGWYNYDVYTIAASGQENDAVKVVNTLKQATYNVEYYFETGVNSGSYEKRDADTGLPIRYFETKTAAAHMPTADRFPDLEQFTYVTEGKGVHAVESLTYDHDVTGSVGTLKLFFKRNMTQADAITGAKVWHNDNGTGKAVMGLYTVINGVESAQPVQVQKNVTDGYEFTGLDNFDANGSPIAYRVYEITGSEGSWTKAENGGIAVVDGIRYRVSYSGNTITNTQLTDLTLEKQWAGDFDRVEKPASVTLRLYADGAAQQTVTLTEGESWTKTLRNLPKYDETGSEIAYTVQEKSDSGVFVGNENTAVLNGVVYDVSIDGLTVTNTVKRADLTVTKTLTGPDALPEDFAIEVKDSRGSASATLTAAGVTPVTVDGGKVYTWTVEDLLTGEMYTATEQNTALEGWTLSGASVTSASAKGGERAELVNRYTRDQANLTVTKTVSGLEAADTGTTHTYQVRITGENHGTAYDRVHSIPVTGNGTNSITVSLPTGSYTVTETADSIPVANYTHDDRASTVSASVSTGGTAALTNVYTRDQAELTIAKTFAPGSDLNGDTLGQSLTFTVKDGDTQVAQVVLNAANHWTQTITVNSNTTYTVTETGGEKAGYTWTPDAAAKTVTVTDSGSVTFSNDYEKQYGLLEDDVFHGVDLNVVKLDENQAGLPGAVFRLVNALPQAMVKTSDEDGKLRFTGLMEGKWGKTDSSQWELTLTEQQAPTGYDKIDDQWVIHLERSTDPANDILDGNVFHKVWNWTISGVSVNGEMLTEGTFIPTSRTLTVQNALSHDGSLTIAKAVTAEPGVTAPDEDFTFTVDFTKAGGSYTVTDEAGAVQASGSIARTNTVTLKQGWKAAFTGIEMKTGYTVTETPDAAYTTAINGQTGSIMRGTITGTAPAHVANVENHYITHGFDLHKTGEAGEALSGVDFRLFTDDSCETPYGDAMTTDGNGEIHVENLPVGTYFLKETAPRTGYETLTTLWQVTVTEDGVTVSEYVKPGILERLTGSEPAPAENLLVNGVLTVENRLIRGTLKLNKIVTGDNGEADRVYSFKLYQGSGTDTTPRGVRVIRDEPIRLTNLSYGVYTLVEDTPADTANFDWQSVTYTADKTGVQPERGVTFNFHPVEGPEADVIEVTAENTYARRGSGVLTVTKAVDTASPTGESLAPDAADRYTFEVQLGTGSDEPKAISGTYFDNAGAENVTYTVTLAQDQTLTLTNVPYGVACSVEETGITSANESHYGALPEAVTLTTDGSDDVTVTNTYFKSVPFNGDGKLTVEKAFGGENDPDAIRPASVTVTLARSVNGVADAAFSKTLTLTAAEDWTGVFTELPKYEDETQLPYAYTVTETAMDYTGVAGVEAVTAHGSGFLITGPRTVSNAPDGEHEVLGVWLPDPVAAAEGQTAAITNSWHPAANDGTGSFVVNKTYTGDHTAQRGNAAFTLTGSGQTIAPAVNADGTQYTFADLPVGTYTLTETAPDGWTGQGPWTVTVAADTDAAGSTLIEVKAPTSGGSIFENLWNWVTNITGSTSSADSVVNVLTVDNTQNADPDPEIKTATVATGDSFRIVKQDKDDQRRLSGAEFQLTSSGQTIWTGTTGEDGVLNVDFTEEQLKQLTDSTVRRGSYDRQLVLSETAAPDGYEALGETWAVTLTATAAEAIENGVYVSTHDWAVTAVAEADGKTLTVENSKIEGEPVIPPVNPDPQPIDPTPVDPDDPDKAEPMNAGTSFRIDKRGSNEPERFLPGVTFTLSYEELTLWTGTTTDSGALDVVLTTDSLTTLEDRLGAVPTGPVTLTLTETARPTGYEPIEPMTVTAACTVRENVMFADGQGGFEFRDVHIWDVTAIDGQPIDASHTQAVTNTWITADFSFSKLDADAADPEHQRITGAQFRLMKGGKSFGEATSANGVVTFTGIPVGTYTLEEIAPAPGYETTALTGLTVTVNEDRTVTYTRTAYNPNVVIGQEGLTVKNHKGDTPVDIEDLTVTDGTSLTIHKTGRQGAPLTGAAFQLTWKQGDTVLHFYDSDNLPATKDGKLALTIPGSKLEQIPGIADKKVGETVALTLTEVTAPEGYDRSENAKSWPVVLKCTEITYTLEGDTFTKHSDWTVESVNGQTLGADRQFTVTNQIVTGSLTVEKVITGEAAAQAQGDSFAFTLTGTDASGKPVTARTETVTYDPDGVNTVTFADLPYGSYTVTEAQPDHTLDWNWTDVIYSGDAVTDNSEAGTASSAAVVFHPEQAGTVAVTAENSYAKKTDGQLTVTKAVTGVNAPDGDAFTFTVALGDGSEDVAVTGSSAAYTANGRYTVELTDGQSFTITGIQRGTEYTITEADDASYVTDRAEITGAIVNDEAVRETVTNHYYTTPDIPTEDGALRFYKYELGTTVPVEGAGFTLTETTTGKTYTASSDADGLVFFESIPVGTYTLAETAQAPGYEALPGDALTGLTITVDKTDGVTFEKALFSGDWFQVGSNQLAVYNQHRTDGKISVTKALRGVADTDAAFDRDFTFELLDADQASTGKTLTIAAGETGTFEGLRTGETYFLREVSPQRPGYDLTHSAWTGEGYQVTVAADPTEPVAVTCTNTYDQTAHDLTVTKSVTGRTTDETFELVVTLGSGTENGAVTGHTAAYTANGVYTFALADGETATIENVPYGVSYTVEETRTDDFSYLVAGEVTEAKTFNQTNHAETVVNSYVASSAFVVKKADSRDGRGLANAEFTLKKGEDAVKTYTTDENGYVTIADLPVGEYTLTETTAPAGYEKVDAVWTIRVSLNETGTQVELKKDAATGNFIKQFINSILTFVKGDEDLSVTAHTITLEGGETLDTALLTVENTPARYDVTVIKTENGQPLPGAAFRLNGTDMALTENSTNTFTATVDYTADALTVSETAPIGYKAVADFGLTFAVENNTVTGLALTEAQDKVSVEGFTVTVENEKDHGEIIIPDIDPTPEADPVLEGSGFTIVKTDAEDTAARLSGAAFKLYTDADCTDELDANITYTTGADGTVAVTIDGEALQTYLTEAGLLNETTLTLYLKETAAPVSYELSEAVSTLTLTRTVEQDVLLGDQFHDIHRWDVTAATGETLTWTAAAEGEPAQALIVNDRDYGEDVTPDVIPDPQDPDPKPDPEEPIPDGKEPENYVTAGSSFRIVKTDAAEGSKLLPGAQFRLYTDAAMTHELEAGKTYTTDENGSVGVTLSGDALKNADPAQPLTLYLKEVKAPNGYQGKDHDAPADAPAKNEGRSWTVTLTCASDKERIGDQWFVVNTWSVTEVAGTALTWQPGTDEKPVADAILTNEKTHDTPEVIPPVEPEDPSVVVEGSSIYLRKLDESSKTSLGGAAFALTGKTADGTDATVWTGTTEKDQDLYADFDPAELAKVAGATDAQVGDTLTLTLTETAAPGGYLTAGPWTVTLRCDDRTEAGPNADGQHWFRYTWTAVAVTAADGEENLLDGSVLTVADPRDRAEDPVVPGIVPDPTAPEEQPEEKPDPDQPIPDGKTPADYLTAGASFRIHKTNKRTGEPMADVEFTLTAKQADAEEPLTLWTGKTDEEGMLDIRMDGKTLAQLPGAADKELAPDARLELTLTETIPSGYKDAGPWTAVLTCEQTEEQIGDQWYTVNTWSVTELDGQAMAAPDNTVEIQNVRRSGGGGGDRTPEPDPEPEIVIPEPEIPLVPAPEEPEILIPEEETPLADAPKTGDSTLMLLLAAAASGLGVVFLALTGRKRKDEEQ